MARWKAWINDLGDAVVGPGTPLGMSKTVSSDGVTNDGGPNPLSGFSIIEADDMNAALKTAKGCPSPGNGHRHNRGRASHANAVTSIRLC